MLAAPLRGGFLYGELNLKSRLYNHLDDAHASQTSHINCAPSEVRENAEADQRTDDETRVDTHIEVERLCGVESSSFYRRRRA